MSERGNLRRAERKKINETILVEDAIAERTPGWIGNISEGGLMLICSEELADDAIYQIRFTLPPDNGTVEPPMEIGVHEQWTEQAAISGQYWSGVRIIAISAEDDGRLRKWLAQAGE